VHLSDGKKADTGMDGWLSRLVVPTGSVPAPSATAVVTPFWGFPQFLSRTAQSHSGGVCSGSRERLTGDRHYRVSFAGNCDVATYVAADTVCRPRAKVLLSEAFRGQSVFVEQWHQKKLLQDAQRTFLLFVDSWKAGLNASEYDKVLSESDFFLVLPGVGSALTHSLHECLSFGCVPILSQSAALSAQWCHGVNCLQYIDERSLVGCLETARLMSGEEIHRLRMAALIVFEVEFSPLRFVQQVAAASCERVLISNV
jgi:hypothetical protein